MYKITALAWYLLLCLPAVAQVQERAASENLPPVQQKVALRFYTSDADEQTLRKYTYAAILPDSVAAHQEVQALVHRLQQEAYLLASADSAFIRNDTLHVELHVGQPFAWAHLRNGNLSEGILLQSGFREKFYHNMPFKPAEYVKLQQRITALCRSWISRTAQSRAAASAPAAFQTVGR